MSVLDRIREKCQSPEEPTCILYPMLLGSNTSTKSQSLKSRYRSARGLYNARAQHCRRVASTYQTKNTNPAIVFQLFNGGADVSSEIAEEGTFKM
jgi:hypothetical protein